MNYYDDTLEGLVLGDIRNHAVSHHPSGFPFNGHDCTIYLLICLTGSYGVYFPLSDCTIIICTCIIPWALSPLFPFIAEKTKT
jgi:hypothetical protein